MDDKNSFKALDLWLRKLNETSDLTKKPIIIIGNKSDVEENQREVTTQEGKNYADSKGYHFYETSAKTGVNVREAFNDIFEQLYLAFEDEITGKKSVKANLKINKKNKEKKNCC